ncbi:MAG: SPOR domain-containing protein [Treponema sp.]|jgi:hypothetical protein|nr:SPOR domain-containing protein [Treponema sp.]
MKRLFVITGLFFILSAADAQDTSILLAAEIQSVEKALSNPSLSAQERKNALITMARLFELSGNIEGAAGAWLEASAGNDHAALLRAAYCLAALGEFDEADKTALGALNGKLEKDARCLHGYIEALKNGNTGPLRQLLTDAAYREFHPRIYYGLWRITGDEAAKTALLRDFPQSPEALVAAESVNPAPTALWLLQGGSMTIEPPAAPQSPPAPIIVESAPAGGPVLLQTGLFSSETNARAAAERLRGSGFAPLITRRTVNGREYWAVGVTPGRDPNATLLGLKDSGFDAFPVY